MVYAFLIALFALDSLTTYAGITCGAIGEGNVLVRNMIEMYGLGFTMAFIFAFKTFFVLCARTYCGDNRLPWRYCAAVYTSVLLWCWAPAFAAREQPLYCTAHECVYDNCKTIPSGGVDPCFVLSPR